LAIFFALASFFAPLALPQISRPSRPGAPPLNFVDVEAVTQELDGPLRKLRGAVRLETTEMVLYADEVDLNNDTSYAEARGNVHFKHFVRHEEIWASKAEYYIDDEKGKFYDVVGTTVTRIQTRPGVLSSTSPFHFEGKWAERLGEKYILHDGMITNCRMPRPWWTLRGPKFDIIPDDRALAYKAIFRVRKLPLFYTPFFYKSLARVPRRSGFLTPNVGNSSSRGKMFGVGYFGPSTAVMTPPTTCRISRRAAWPTTWSCAANPATARISTLSFSACRIGAGNRRTAHGSSRADSRWW